MIRSTKNSAPNARERFPRAEEECVVSSPAIGSTKLGRFALLAVFAMILSGASSRNLFAQEPSLDTASLLRETAQHWSAYREAVLKPGARIQVVEHKTATVGEEVIDRTITTRLVYDRRIGAVQKSLFDSANEKQILGRNPRYRFEIRRENPETNPDWRIVGVRRLPQQGMSLTIEAKENEVFHRAQRLLADEGLAIMNTTIRELFADDTFQIESARTEKLDGTDFVRLHCKASSSKKNLARLRTATLWLDPSRYWLLQKAIVQYGFENSQGKGQGELTYTYQYRISRELPVIEKVTCVSIAHDASGKVVAEGNNTYSYTIELTQPTEEEFYLVYYGLPEPKFAPEDSS